MSTLPRQNQPITPQPARDSTPRRLIVTAGVATFAIRNWTLWALLREGPWGPPMRLVLGKESVTDAVERTLDALLLWSTNSMLLQLKAGWQEHQVHVWGSSEQGAAVSLIHSILLRANRDELRPNLHRQPIPSLHVKWVPVAEIESGAYALDADVQPGMFSALHALRSQVQREPEVVLRYLADMGSMRPASSAAPADWWRKESTPGFESRTTIPLNIIKEPATGDGTLTLAEASLLYRAFFSPDEQIDLSNLRRRLLATNRLEATEESRPVRGKELEWRRISRVYRYLG